MGWHIFPLTYWAWRDETGELVGVQQRLMRYADVSTTMKQYGRAQMETKSKANSKVVKMVLRIALRRCPSAKSDRKYNGLRFRSH
jgi:integrase